MKRSKTKSTGVYCPPKKPWIAMQHCSIEKAPLSYYYSDLNSEVPIRDISHKKDPKPDPNIETKSFGLFSPCNKPMRRSIVVENLGLHFFCTRREDVRVLTGYYRYGWYYESPLDNDDFMLAAKEVRFVAPGFQLSDLTDYLRGNRIDGFFRPFKYLKGDTPNLLLKLLEQSPDATKQYVSEIKRIEQEVLREKGKIYLDRVKGFDWKEAYKPMGLNP